MDAFGVAPQLLSLAIVVEIAGAAMLTALAAFFLRTDFSQEMQQIQFMKNFTIISGLAVV